MVSMRSIFVVFSGFLSISSLAATETENWLTDAQEKKALEVIDGSCGDSWCEGDFEFEFTSLVCTQATGSCRLHFVQTSYLDDDIRNEDYCELQDVTSFDQMVEKLTYQHDDEVIEYEDTVRAFYDKISDCLINEGFI